MASRQHNNERGKRPASAATARGGSSSTMMDLDLNLSLGYPGTISMTYQQLMNEAINSDQAGWNPPVHQASYSIPNNNNPGLLNGFAPPILNSMDISPAPTTCPQGAREMKMKGKNMAATRGQARMANLQPNYINSSGYYCIGGSSKSGGGGYNSAAAIPNSGGIAWMANATGEAAAAPPNHNTLWSMMNYPPPAAPPASNFPFMMQHGTDRFTGRAAASQQMYDQYPSYVSGASSSSYSSSSSSSSSSATGVAHTVMGISVRLNAAGGLDTSGYTPYLRQMIMEEGSIAATIARNLEAVALGLIPNNFPVPHHRGEGNLYFPKYKKCLLCLGEDTPLWRGGPFGPKSLCNACGIKFGKEEKRRAARLAATAAAEENY